MYRDVSNSLSFEAERTATAICGRAIEGVLNVINTCCVAGIRNGRDELSVYLAGCNLVPVGIVQAYDNAISRLYGSTYVNHVLCSFCEYIGIFHKVLSAFFDLITFQKIEASGQFRNTLVT